MKIFKKYVLLLLCSLFLFTGCVQKEKSDEEVVDYLKNIKSYQCNVMINLYNNKQNNQYQCKLYYDCDKGSRVEIGDSRVQIYKNDKVIVKDKVSGKQYQLDKDFDKVYTLSFLDKYMELMYVNEDTKYYVKQENGEKHQFVELTIPGTNPNMNKAVLKVNVKQLVPEDIIVFDNKGKERIRIDYNNFNANDRMDDNLFE